MNRVQIIIKSLIQLAGMACLSLLLSGCGKEASAPQPETSGQTGVPSTLAAPDILPDTLKIKRGKTTYVISGIGLKGEKKVAIINNKVVKPGAEIDTGVVLEDVQPTYAILRVGNTRHLLRPEDIQRELDKKK